MMKGGWGTTVTAMPPPGLSIPWAAGRYYSSTIFLGAVTAQMVVELQARAVPLYVPPVGGAGIDRIGIEVTIAAEAGKKMRLGIYADLQGRPWEIIEDAGTIDVDSTGFKEITLSPTLWLPQGWLWLAIVGESYSTNPYVRELGTPCFWLLGDEGPAEQKMLNHWRAVADPSWVADKLPKCWPMPSTTILSIEDSDPPSIRVRAA